MFLFGYWYNYTYICKKGLIIPKLIMQNTDIQRIKSFMLSKKIITFNELQDFIGNLSRMTLIRRLRELSYLTSYSHTGRYYTLGSIPKFSEEGLWSYKSVYFSKFDTLVNTCQNFVNNSESGYSVKELQDILHVDVKLPLIDLQKQGKLHREKCRGGYVYFNKHYPRRKQQLIIRNSQNEATVLNIGKLSSHVITDELKAAIILFYSILDEKQRRLYAGLESLKIGHGGDNMISQLLEIDPETVSKGRKELIIGHFEKSRVRKPGAGRPEIKKNSTNN